MPVNLPNELIQWELTNGSLMMLASDFGLRFDSVFSTFVVQYAQDLQLWNNDFAAAYAKLLNLGVAENLAFNYGLGKRSISEDLQENHERAQRTEKKKANQRSYIKKK